jgi:hypothetical protein
MLFFHKLFIINTDFDQLNIFCNLIMRLYILIVFLNKICFLKYVFFFILTFKSYFYPLQKLLSEFNNQLFLGSL